MSRSYRSYLLYYEHYHFIIIPTNYGFVRAKCIIKNVIWVSAKTMIIIISSNNSDEEVLFLYSLAYICFMNANLLVFIHSELFFYSLFLLKKNLNYTFCNVIQITMNSVLSAFISNIIYRTKFVNDYLHSGFITNKLIEI